MNIESNSYQTTSPNCKGCKVFYASEAFNGYCSTCFKKQKGNVKEDMEKPKSQKIQVKVETPKIQQQKTDIPVVQKEKNKCYNCNRKVKNLGIQCKCGFVFCTIHRLPEDHNCAFDHGGAAVKKLEKDLIKVANEKITQIG